MVHFLTKNWLQSALAVLAAFLLAAGSHLALAEPAIHEPAPELSVETADGRPFDLASMRGKVVLVNFWATWCAPCIEELPAIGKFWADHRAQGFEVIALSIDRPKDREKAKKLIAKLPFKSALLTDVTRNGFGTPEAVPVSFLIDARGVVRDKFVNIDKELLDETVLPLLKKAEKPAAAGDQL
jgi:cytochrome c biogenesis protein CcmG, thiol:disulfide interchange protein DsbE